MRFLKMGSGISGSILFAHGAGAPMDSEWMQQVCKSLSQYGIQTLRFEFPYMLERRLTGKKRPPDKAKKLQDSWLDSIKKNKKTPFFLMGKSMGSRIASHVINTTAANGLICLGFPFHPPGKDLSDRHLPLLKTNTPCLILQGERDPMGNKQSLKKLKFKQHQKLVWLPDGDHSWKPRKSSGHTLNENINTSAKHIASFLERNS